VALLHIWIGGGSHSYWQTFQPKMGVVIHMLKETVSD